jgi:tetratricopeptide (TPR) repeat protein
MSPEQATQAAGTDHRVDLYSLGVVAYELLSGAPPFGQRSRHELLKARQDEQPEPLAGLRPDLPPALIALVMGLLSKLPEGRPPDADTVVRAIDQMVAAPGEAVPGTGRARSYLARRRAAWIGGAVVAMLVAGFMITRAMGVGPAASMLATGALRPSDALLVADFDIRGGVDTSLGAVMAELVRTDLRQSNVVTLVPASTVRPALQRMGRPAGTPLVSAIGRELAQREGIKAVVEGDLTPLGAGFMVTLRLVSAEGDELASFHQATDPPELIPTVGRLTRQLRGRIGESLKAIRASPPLRQVTTPSLEALRKYTEGVRVLSYDRDLMRTATLLKEALELDSTFAMAWTALAATYRDAGMPPDLANEADERAYRHRDRLPDRERYHAVGSYFRRGPGRDRARAAEAYEAGLRLDTGFFANSLGLLYQSRREYARAESLFRFLVVSGSGSLATHQNLTNALYFQGKREAAESLSEETRRRFAGEGRWLRLAQFLYHRGQLDSAQHALERQRAEGHARLRVWAAYELSQLHSVRGRLAEAERAFSEGAAADPTRGSGPTPSDELWAAFVDVWHRRRPELGLQRLEALLANRPLDSVPLQIGPVLLSDTYYLEAARIYAMAGRPDRARAVLARFTADLRDTAFTRASAPTVHSVLGEIALAEGRPLVALEEFRRADRLPDGPVHSCAICCDADVGRSLDQAGMADSAIVAFERYLETPQLHRLWQDRIYAARILQRLGELYEAKGNRTKAIEYYERFAALWRNADPELQPQVAAVRRRIDSLRAGERR